MPLAAILVHPFTVCVTVYVAAEVTVIDDVVSPVLHNSEPAKPVAVNAELSQLLTTDTIGAEGTAFGAAIPLPSGLVHPSTVCVTIYVPGAVTIMDDVVSPVLHNKLPVNSEAVNKELPQLFTTVTTGATPKLLDGAATPLPGTLVHPFIVCVTVYFPAVATVIDEVVSPVLHNNGPVNPDAVSVELPQLFTTDTVGTDGIVFGTATPFPAGLVHPLIV